MVQFSFRGMQTVGANMSLFSSAHEAVFQFVGSFKCSAAMVAAIIGLLFLGNPASNPTFIDQQLALGNIHKTSVLGVWKAENSLIAIF